MLIPFVGARILFRYDNKDWSGEIIQVRSMPTPSRLGTVKVRFDPPGLYLQTEYDLTFDPDSFQIVGGTAPDTSVNFKCSNRKIEFTSSGKPNV